MERPHSRYTREKTWGALYSQHVNAGYALVPWSSTNNSIALIRCKSPEEVQETMRQLLTMVDECATFYAKKLLPEQAPELLKRARTAVVLAKSSDYHHYHLADHTDFSLVIAGLHDSYLNLPMWETRSNKRYKAREMAVKIGTPEFEQIRATQYGHNILLGALVTGDPIALEYLKKLPSERTRYRIAKEVDTLQHKRYQGRPLAFQTDEKRQEIGAKISEGLLRYHQQRKARA